MELLMWATNVHIEPWGRESSAYSNIITIYVTVYYIAKEGLSKKHIWKK